MKVSRGTERRRSAWESRRALAGLALLAMLAFMALVTGPAHALKPITVTADQDRIEITSRSEVYEGRGDTLPIETAPGPDGATERIVVRSSTPGLNPSWLVFALHNPTEKAIELWLTADRYNVVGSGVVWPDLDARRVEAVTHSAGFAPERIKNDRVDIFRLTIERGQTVTYVAELASDRFSRIYLWKPLDFEQRQREHFLFNGIMLGIMGLMAVFLTAVFAANHKLIFPASALVAWCVLALLCVDFGFWHKLFQMRPEDNAQYRAAAEAAIAASLVIFLFTFLRVNLWHGFARVLFGAWIVGQLGIVATAILDPRLAATVARLSIGVIGVFGMLIIGFLAARRLERALALVPTWIFFLVWLFGAAVTLTGRIPGEFAIFGLVSGLVLIMVLIGFTVTQFAFRSNEPVYGVNPSQRQLKLAAIEQAGVTVWEWTARRNEIKLDTEIEAALGLGPGELPTKVEDFLSLVHPADRERFDLALQAIREHHGGSLRLDLRLRHTDSSYRCFELEGATVPTRDRRTLRCVGLVRDITDAKRAQERLLHNAVHDSLTGLPNRELFVDRLDTAIVRARSERTGVPTVFFFDLDKFRTVNKSFGLIVGDSILLTVSRRLARHLGPQDTLARIGSDQFAMLLLGQHDIRELAQLSEHLRIALKSPIRIAGQEIVLTGAIGVALYDSSQATGRDLLREAEVAMHRAKRAGSDRLEIFRPEMRTEKDDRAAIEVDLRRAVEAGQLKMLYQPIVALGTEELVGLEALVRWEHPKLGTLWPADFVPAAEDSDLIVLLGSFILDRVATDIARWQKELSRPEQPLFVSVNISSRQLIRPDLAQEVRHVTGRAVLPRGTLRLEITEALVMENPEQATQILDLLRDAGVGLTLDEFGAGYSSIAYVNRFPFDSIKIDKGLVQTSSQDPAGAAMVRSIVALALELGKKVVAEGVETPEEAAFLRSIGCQQAQGFYYGEPMAEAEIGRLVKLIRKADRRMRRRGLVRAQEKKKAAAAAAAIPDAGAPPSAGPGQAPAAAIGIKPHPASPAPAPASSQNGLLPRTGPTNGNGLRSPGPTTPARPAGMPAPHYQPVPAAPHQGQGQPMTPAPYPPAGGQRTQPAHQQLPDPSMVGAPPHPAMGMAGAQSGQGGQRQVPAHPGTAARTGPPPSAIRPQATTGTASGAPAAHPAGAQPTGMPKPGLPTAAQPPGGRPAADARDAKTSSSAPDQQGVPRTAPPTQSRQSGDQSRPTQQPANKLGTSLASLKAALETRPQQPTARDRAGQRRNPRQPDEVSTLPPGLAASLAKIAGSGSGKADRQPGGPEDSDVPPTVPSKKSAAE
jgi:diguanylate cyclase (GGDEF)-like protein